MTPSSKKPPTAGRPPGLRPGDHRLLACLTPAEIRRLKQTYPEAAEPIGGGLRKRPGKKDN